MQGDKKWRDVWAMSKEWGQPLEAKGGKGKDSPWSLQKEHGPANTLILGHIIHVRFLTSRTVRNWFVLFRGTVCSNML